MPVPSYRVPVRVARGTKAALDAGLADLQEGEICYATDENALYVVESGVLTPAGSAISSASIGDLADVVVTSASTGEVLRYNGTSWVDAQLAYSDLSGTPTLGTAAAANTGDFATAAQGALADTAIQPADSIDALADVDTTAAAPTNGQVLQWNGTNWVPATPAPGGVAQIIAGTNVTIDPVGGTGAVTINATGGGGGGGAGVIQTSFTTESQTASSGAATFSGIGQSGQLVSVASTLDAWIVLYPTAADRTADAGRAYGTDPAPGSGVLAEFYVTSGGTILATPGTTYFNNDATKASAIYAAVRNQAGANVDSGVTLACYAASGVLGYRTTISATTASLANGAAGDITFSGTGKSGRFVSVETDRAAWVTLYISAAARTADASRPEGTDPTGGAGVLAEVITAGAGVVKFTPALGYFNDEATPVSELYAKVVNKSGGTSTVQVDLTVVPAEA